MPFRYRLEFSLLLGFVFFLPLFEAPKNLLWLGFVVAWLVNRLGKKDFGGPWDRWDSLILLWAGSVYVGAAFAGLHHSEWGGANDVLRYVAVLWMVKRSSYGERALTYLLLAPAASAAVALGGALWTLYVSHSTTALQLNSVGHVNHSAIYLALSLGAALTACLAFWERCSVPWRIAAALLVAFLALGLLVTASRGAILAAVVMVLALAGFWFKRSRVVGIVLIALVVTAGMAAVGAKVEVVKKQEELSQRQNVLSYRDKIWHTGVLAFTQYPAFGVGIGNFGQIHEAEVVAWARKDRGADLSQYMPYAHAHSLFVGALAERGAWGFSILVAVLAYWAYRLWHDRPKADDREQAWALWGGSLGTWIINVVAGMVNTTLHHEHGILSVLLLGIWLAYRSREASDAVPQKAPSEALCEGTPGADLSACQ